MSSCLLRGRSGFLYYQEDSGRGKGGKEGRDRRWGWTFIHFSNTDWTHALCQAVLHVSQSRGLRSGTTEPWSAPLRSEGTGGPEPADRSPSRFTGKLRAQVHPYLLLFPHRCCLSEQSWDVASLCPSSLRIPSRSFGIHSWNSLQIDSHTSEHWKWEESAGNLTDVAVLTVFCKFYVS